MFLTKFGWTKRPSRFECNKEKYYAEHWYIFTDNFGLILEILFFVNVLKLKEIKERKATQSYKNQIEWM